MEFSTLENKLQKKIEEMIELINSADNDLEKVVTLNNFWTKIYHFADDLKNNEYYVAKQIVLDFFNKYKEHNDYLTLTQEGSSWTLYAFAIPLCYICPVKKTVKFYSMYSINGEFSRLKENYGKHLIATTKKINYLDNKFLNKTDFQLFVNMLKEKQFMSISKIQKAKEKLKERKEKELKNKKNIETTIHNQDEQLVKLLSFINSITSDLYKNFITEGWTCKMEDIEQPHLYYFNDSIHCFELKDEMKGQGLSVRELSPPNASAFEVETSIK